MKQLFPSIKTHYRPLKIKTEDLKLQSSTEGKGLSILFHLQLKTGLVSMKPSKKRSNRAARQIMLQPPALRTKLWGMHSVLVSIQSQAVGSI